MKAIFTGLFFILILSACKKEGLIADYKVNDFYAGGSQTFIDQSSGAFSHTINGLSAREESVHGVGDKTFEATFVSAPAPINPGLGPIFNDVSCVACHPSDGRNRAPKDGELIHNLLVRISVPGSNADGGPLPVPGLGLQLQPRAIAGHTPEADVMINYTYINGTFDDGTPYELRKPSYTFNNVNGVWPSDVLYSARLSRPVFGLGLLESIPEWALIANQDLFDADGDGISGKANYVWNVKENKMSIGRFGWKAGTPTLLQQVGFAFLEDIGVSNFLFTDDGGKDLSDSLIYAVEFYLKTLGVPARRNTENEQVIRGKQVFGDSYCMKCHIPQQRTAVNVAFKPLSNQVIFPYTDLLLHDMGADLADNRGEYEASGAEWRTPPLWGIGLTLNVNGHTNFLHDGRARSLTEAILWHGGEAQKAKEKFLKMKSSDRDALLAFLKSL